MLQIDSSSDCWQKGKTMQIHKWVSGCEVRACTCTDGKSIYVNVQYFKPGQSLYQPPTWEKSALIANDEAGRRLVFEYTSTLVDAFTLGKIRDHSFVKVESCLSIGI